VYPLTIGLTIETKELWEEVKASLQDLPIRIVLDQAEIGDWAEFLEKVDRLRPDVVLIDITKLTEPLEEVVARFRSTAAAPMVIALNTFADPDTILQALRAGVNEYLYPPLQANLRKALERKSAEQKRTKEGARAGKVIGFLSAKGGCGATTVCCHTAVELGKQGDQKVLLADFDMEAGAISFLMKTKSQYSVVDAVNNLHRLDFSYWKALVSNGIPNLEIISAPSTLAAKELPRQEQLRHVLAFAKAQYDWTVIDLGRSLTRNSMCILEDIDEAFLVTTLDIPALHWAKQIIKTLLDSGYGRQRLRLLLNRMPKRLDVTPADLERMLGLPAYAMIAEDYPQLYEAYSEGKLVPPNSPLGKQLGDLAGKISGVQVDKKKKFTLFG
jgi:pilus assembly protein CpaE